MMLWKYVLACVMVASSISTSSSQERTYEAEAFECNKSNDRIKRNTKVKNGESIKVCVKPNRAVRSLSVEFSSTAS